jgi:hypothetical protein
LITCQFQPPGLTAEQTWTGCALTPRDPGSYPPAAVALTIMEHGLAALDSAPLRPGTRRAAGQPRPLRRDDRRRSRRHPPGGGGRARRAGAIRPDPVRPAARPGRPDPPGTSGKYGLLAQVLLPGMAVYADAAAGSTGPQLLYQAIGAGNLRAFIPGQDDRGGAGLSN